MKEYQHFLLDWDGCLGQTVDVWFDGYRKTYEEFGQPQTDEELVKFSFGNQYGPLERGIEDLEGFMEALMSRVHEDLKVADLYPGAREFIAALRNKKKNIVLTTSSPRNVIEAALKHNGLSDGSFNDVLTADEVIKHKPDPEMIFKALATLSVDGELDQTIIVGDTKSDLGAANNAGIDSILFFPESHANFHSLEDLKKFNPTYIFDSFESITRSIK